jgi:hypothetical protein
VEDSCECGNEPPGLWLIKTTLEDLEIKVVLKIMKVKGRVKVKAKL